MWVREEWRPHVSKAKESKGMKLLFSHRAVSGTHANGKVP